MSKYIFTVRQRFGEKPQLDTFYKIELPDVFLDPEFIAGGEELIPSHIIKQMREVKANLRVIELRLRFNIDMFPHVCLVSVKDMELSRDMFDAYITNMSTDELMCFLEESKL